MIDLNAPARRRGFDRPETLATSATGGPPDTRSAPRPRWRGPAAVVRFFTRVFAIIGILVVLSVAVGATIGYQLFVAGPELPDRIVLRFDLDRQLPDHGRGDPVTGALFGEETSLADVTAALDRARDDERVRGLVLRLASDELSLAQAQALRVAVARFRESGRFAWAFAETFGELGPANGSFYLASGFERIVVQPVGLVGLTGILIEVPFLRGLLDRYGIRPEVEQREAYKSAANSLTKTGFTRAHREMLESLIDDLSDQLVDGVAQGRGLDPETVSWLIDRGPLLADEALGGGLIDAVGYLDEVVAEARTTPRPVDAEAGRSVAEAEMVDLIDYLAIAGPPHDDGPAVALIHAAGAIQRGAGSPDPLLGDAILGADRVVQAITEAVEDEVEAIILRIDSPGGSAVASETIRRAVVQARESGVPVIVSMADTAASGGYWIASGADRIIANPATLTGSIGVVGGKVSTNRFWQDFDVAWGRLTRGANAAMGSVVKRYSKEELTRLETVLDDIYDAFLARVGSGRSLSASELDVLAGGRVWTGRQAVDGGLVDEVGDLHLAVVRAGEAAGHDADDEVSLVTYPRPESMFDIALKLLMGGGDPLALAAAIERWSRGGVLALMGPVLLGR